MVSPSKTGLYLATAPSKFSGQLWGILGIILGAKNFCRGMGGAKNFIFAF